jgi:hypothetical protein
MHANGRSERGWGCEGSIRAGCYEQRQSQFVAGSKQWQVGGNELIGDSLEIVLRLM